MGKLDGTACVTMPEGMGLRDVRRSHNFKIFRNEVARDSCSHSSSGANAQPGMPLRPNSAPSPDRGAMLWKVGPSDPSDQAQSTMPTNASLQSPRVHKMNAEGDGEVGYTVGRDGLVTADGD